MYAPVSRTFVMITTAFAQSHRTPRLPKRRLLLGLLACLFALGLVLTALVSPAHAKTVQAEVYKHSTSVKTDFVTMSYDDEQLRYGNEVTFTFDIDNPTKTYKFNIHSIWYNDYSPGSSWMSLVDVSNGYYPYSSYREDTTFKESFYCAGSYKISFNIFYRITAEDEDPKYTYETFDAYITVSEGNGFKKLSTIAGEIVAQCNAACAGSANPKYDKALWFNDWLTSHCEYNYAYSSAEGALARGKGSCEAFHDGYAMLLNRAGIDARRVDSAGDNHVWTGVQLDDGKWYNVDVTWNNPMGTQPATAPDLRHLYFALPNEIMALVHREWDQQWTTKLGGPRYSFDAHAYEDSYFIKSGKIQQYVDPLMDSIQGHLDAKDAKFSLTVPRSSWPDNYKNVIYNLAAYHLSHRAWASGTTMNVSYGANELSFAVTYDDGQPAGGEEPTNPTTPTTPDTPTTPTTPTTPENPSTPSSGSQISSTAMYRLYNPYSGEHLFTSDRNEYQVLPGYGWVQEGVAWQSPQSGEPVYRLYNPYSGDHHYTMDANEYKVLPRYGWRQEGCAFYSTARTGTPVYRLYNPYVSVGTHHYTLDAHEYAVLAGRGWVQEGEAWFGLR